MQHSAIVVFDFETTSTDKDTCEILEIGAVVINPKNLQLYKGETFESLMKPLDFDAIRDDALAKNKLTREILEEAPEPEEVWHQFREFVNRFNNKGKADTFNAPIPGGHRITKFDLPIAERYCKKYGPMKQDRFGVMVPSLFSDFMIYDSQILMAYWAENLQEPSRVAMDYLRKFMGYPEHSAEEAHKALPDAHDEADLLIRLLRLEREIAPHIKFKDCYNRKIEDDAREYLQKKKAKVGNKPKLTYNEGRGH